MRLVKALKRFCLITMCFFAAITGLKAQDFMVNIPNRSQISLNGKWECIIDPVDVGIKKWKSLYKDVPNNKDHRTEYAFISSNTLNVPGDFNSQRPELKFYESTVWYKKVINVKKKKGKRLFLYFDAVNYVSDVFLNSEKLGSHEGGFTPFQFEITNKVKDGENAIIIRVNNRRQKEGVPALGYDWVNYGGITRDVRLVETNETFIEDYFVQLKKGSGKRIEGYIQLNGSKLLQKISIKIPEAKINHTATTDHKGNAKISIDKKLELWSPSNPKLYRVIIQSETDSIEEHIGFRSISTNGTEIILNGQPIFLKGVNFHEEASERASRAYTKEDAKKHLNMAQELGCNFIRTAHYPQNEYVVRLAEEMGFMLWEEIPVFQGISFGNKKTVTLANKQLTEMLRRDKNRCAVIIWSVSNETYPNHTRTSVLKSLVDSCRVIDNTRLVSTALNKYEKKGNVFTIKDDLIEALDVIGMNQYLGWYNGWTVSPEDIVWKSEYNKPLIISEFGAEALYGHHGSNDDTSSWSEEFQETFYRKQITMQKNIPFLSGTCPWTLIDFRSPLRLHPIYQDYWNRKGLLSEQGYRKKAWYVMKAYYDTIK
ncbi:glycoside hydrolase family 2 protein [Flavivirga algicola]|nr:glycoside hydrolase family 2 TIM barrel-domain containing protein [Flavivirga algicola]